MQSPTQHASGSLASSSSVPTLIELTPEQIKRVKDISSSKKNFAAKLVHESFSKEVLISSNVNGRKGKNKLDPDKISAIRKIVYSYWPLKPGSSEDKDWSKKCTKAIDEAGRRLKRKSEKKKKKREKTPPLLHLTNSIIWILSNNYVVN